MSDDDIWGDTPEHDDGPPPDPSEYLDASDEPVAQVIDIGDAARAKALADQARAEAAWREARRLEGARIDGLVLEGKLDEAKAILEALAAKNPAKTAGLAITWRAGSEYTWPPPKRKWVSEYLAIAPGRATMLCAPPGVGKGWLSMLIAWSTAGDLFFGECGRAAEPGPVAWLDYEEGDEELWRRHVRMRVGFQPEQVDDSKLRYLDCTLSTGRTFDNPAFVAYLETALVGHSVCVVDNLTECFTVKDRNTADARLPLVIMNRISLKTGCAFAVIYHPRKESKETRGAILQEAVAGAQGIIGSLGSIWVGRATPDGTLWRHAKCNGRQKSKPFMLTWEDTDDGGMQVSARPHEDKEPETDAEAREAQKGESRAKDTARLQNAIIDLVKQKPGCSTRYIIGEVSGSNQRKHDQLAVLVGNGVLRVEKGSNNTVGHWFNEDRSPVAEVVNAPTKTLKAGVDWESVDQLFEEFDDGNL